MVHRSLSNFRDLQLKEGYHTQVTSGIKRYVHRLPPAHKGLLRPSQIELFFTGHLRVMVHKVLMPPQCWLQ